MTQHDTRNDLHVGVAKVDITPHHVDGLNSFGDTFRGVHDRLFLRALVLTEGDATVAVVATDLLEVADTAPARQRIERELGIPADAILITASHSHNAPRIGEVRPGAMAVTALLATAAYTEQVLEALIDALRSARDTAQAARVGIGRGGATVNVNRDVRTAARWVEGFSLDGPSDHDVRVLRFTALDGRLIAVLANYAVHCTVALGTDEVSADLAGAAAAHAEARLGDGAVVLWTPGALGDQGPRFSFASMRGTPDDPAPAWAAAAALGMVVGEEVVRVASTADPVRGGVQLRWREEVVPLPTRAEVPAGLSLSGGHPPTVDLRVLVLLIGRIALVGVSGEVGTSLWTRLRDGSALRDTWLVSLANDRIGYLTDDDAHRLATFEGERNPVAPGHLEALFAEGVPRMIEQASG